jgi:metallophosphoesterase (TIGR00282 family)
MAFRTLLIGDIVGNPGRRAVEALVPQLVKTLSLDLVIANGENAAGGSGITPAIFEALRHAGVDVITSGDHCYRKKEAMSLYESQTRLLRPANLPEAAAGSGWTIVESRSGVPAAVINLQGRTFMKPIDCPFLAVERALGEISRQIRMIFIDMHAEATSDKIALGWHLDGRVTAVVGTHTHVQTADERVLPKGTAYLTDLGMTGPYDGVLGRNRDRVIKFLTTAMPTYFDVTNGDVHLCGCIVEADADTGKAMSIERINLPFDGGSDNHNASEALQEND